MSVTHSLTDALRDAELVVSAVPSHGCRAVMMRAAPSLAADAVIVSATKGLEARTLLRMSEVIGQEAGATHPVVVLSGPSFAIEVAHQLPTAILAASQDEAAIALVQHEFRGPYFRLYGSDDVAGVEIGAAMKSKTRHFHHVSLFEALERYPDNLLEFVQALGHFLLPAILSFLRVLLVLGAA
jgi:glycerol-3-phosphate dehydrogenase (NAD(P)+)